ncbi:MAG TPA: hypothetical protein PKV98_05895 [Burkholderiaceae bacterium]|nr:hypothetical protein [Burkholderiaceae bacterium]
MRVMSRTEQLIACKRADAQRHVNSAVLVRHASDDGKAAADRAQAEQFEALMYVALSHLQ